MNMSYGRDETLKVLIEKDWLSFGHKFSHRYSHLNGDAREVSPVIDQFVECVWQLTEQFPCAFEYNERFLLSIQSHINSCHYGNFICNSEKERKHLCIREKTHSIWPHLWKNKLDYVNPLFRPDHSQTQGVLRPVTSPYCFKFWRGLYNQFDRGLHPRQSALDCLIAVKEEAHQLEEVLAICEQKLDALARKPLKDLCVKKHVPIHISLADIPQDYDGGIFGTGPKVLSLFEDEPKSSARESGEAQNGVTDSDSDKAAFNAA